MMDNRTDLVAITLLVLAIVLSFYMRAKTLTAPTGQQAANNAVDNMMSTGLWTSYLQYNRYNPLAIPTATYPQPNYPVTGATANASAAWGGGLGAWVAPWVASGAVSNA